MYTIITITTLIFAAPLIYSRFAERKENRDQSAREEHTKENGPGFFYTRTSDKS